VSLLFGSVGCAFLVLAAVAKSKNSEFVVVLVRSDPRPEECDLLHEMADGAVMIAHAR
jgi:hypothetical protein